MLLTGPAPGTRRRAGTLPTTLGPVSSVECRLRSTTSDCRSTVPRSPFQVLKEQLLWIERFETLDELRTAARVFGRTYNQHWLIERHQYRTPAEAREHLRVQVAAAA